MSDNDEPIVFKVDQAPNLTKYEACLFEKPKRGQQMSFEVNVVAEALEGMTKRCVVEPNLPTWSAFSLKCDEGAALGGTDTAPPPLGYLSAGIAFCSLTHLTAFIRSRKLNVSRLIIEQRTNFSTSLLTAAEGEGDLRGQCGGVETHIVVESDEPPHLIQHLAKIAQGACLAMQALINQTAAQTRVHLNGEEVGKIDVRLAS